jgi:hypothetical protein
MEARFFGSDCNTSLLWDVAFYIQPDVPKDDCVNIGGISSARVFNVTTPYFPIHTNLLSWVKALEESIMSITFDWKDFISSSDYGWFAQAWYGGDVNSLSAFDSMSPSTALPVTNTFEDGSSHPMVVVYLIMDGSCAPWGQAVRFVKTPNRMTYQECVPGFPDAGPFWYGEKYETYKE